MLFRSQNDDDFMIDILAGEEVQTDMGSSIAAQIRNADEADKKRIIKIVNVKIDDEKALKDEQDAATYLLKQTTKAATLLKGAVDQGLREDAERDGVGVQLGLIRQYVSEIEAWLGQNNESDL